MLESAAKYKFLEKLSESRNMCESERLSMFWVTILHRGWSMQNVINSSYAADVLQLLSFITFFAPFCIRCLYRCIVAALY